METGVARPSFELLHLLAAALGVREKELLNFEDTPWHDTEWEQNTRQFRTQLDRLPAKDIAVLLEVAKRF